MFVGIIDLALGGVQIVAGIKILATWLKILSLSARWHRIALILALSGVALNVLFIIFAVIEGIPGQSVAYAFPVAMYGFVIWALITKQEKFTNL